MKRIFQFIGCSALLGLLLVPSAQSQLSQENIRVDDLMQMKLRSSQSLLAGLTLEDYELILRESQRLQLHNLDAGWNTVQTKDNSRISQEFRAAARKIHQAAEAKNVDAAAIGYFQLTTSCIDCHRHVRTVRAQTHR